MDPEAIVVVPASSVADKNGYVDRDILKKGDVVIHQEAEREREVERLKGGPRDVSNHCLHPQHKLKFHDHGQPFSCFSCALEGTGSRYTCKKSKTCNDVEMHHPCAVSKDIVDSLISENTKLTQFIHEHPLNLINEQSTGRTCSYCNNKIEKQYRYNCEPCNMYFDTICVHYPTRLSSFLHPAHELELRTRRHLMICDMCNEGGDSHARVYSCEECNFFVHPSCAVKDQYSQHSLHPNHHFLLISVPSHPKVKCIVCRKKCKSWCYSCIHCKGVCFHQDCITTASSSTGSTSKTSGESFAHEFTAASSSTNSSKTSGESFAHEFTTASSSTTTSKTSGESFAHEFTAELGKGILGKLVEVTCAALGG